MEYLLFPTKDLEDCYMNHRMFDNKHQINMEHLLIYMNIHYIYKKTELKYFN